MDKRNGPPLNLTETRREATVDHGWRPGDECPQRGYISTYRGKYVQNKIRCFDIPPPPPGVVAALAEEDMDAGPKTIREKLAQHREDPLAQDAIT